MTLPACYLEPILLFVELDFQHLCLNAGYQLDTSEEYHYYRRKSCFREEFHYAQLVLQSPVVNVRRSFADPDATTLLARTLQHLILSPAFSSNPQKLAATDVRLLILQEDFSLPKTRAEYFAHPLAKSTY